MGGRPDGTGLTVRLSPDLRRLAAAALVGGLVLLRSLPVQAVEPGEIPALRSLVEKQLQAFRADDAAAAYALASPAIREMFPTADIFIGMVRQGYPPVYRPRSFAFGEASDGVTGPELSVRLDDADGVGWTATYSFQRQPDGSWAISGCRLVKAPDQSV